MMTNRHIVSLPRLRCESEVWRKETKVYFLCTAAGNSQYNPAVLSAICYRSRNSRKEKQKCEV